MHEQCYVLITECFHCSIFLSEKTDVILSYGEGVLPNSAEASSGPNAHP